ncbi:TspO/MBR family protein [Rhizobium redzepovicii]|uniref:TspO/MBR family protein n=1 Tax=Rhizobium redzepovicii TaxID=2867518 RepID=A0AAW8P799_9HYPH|nr:TspO/MBR family protein [Rhizobium redzepovicii]MDR9762892.1 TspO/MBR family protein [Rhizobium redzepovicii]
MQIPECSPLSHCCARSRLAIGLTIRPGACYEFLRKPFFTPPNSAFGRVWSSIHVLIAVAGWRVAMLERFRSAARSMGRTEIVE